MGRWNNTLLSAAEVNARLEKRPMKLIGPYVGTNIKAQFRCEACGHVWATRPSHIFGGAGCPNCNILRRRLEGAELERRLSERGIALAGEYRNAHAKTELLCLRCQTRWFARTIHLFRRRDTSCPNCTVPIAKRRKLSAATLSARLQELNKRGIVLRGPYVDTNIKTTFECRVCGHGWLTRPMDLFRGTCGCPRCARMAETSCRVAIEALTGRKFPDTRPEWLCGMRLDGYCTAMALAFEYDGEQHYRHVKYFHATRKEWLAQRRRDRKKDALCRINGVALIRIPFWIVDHRRFIQEALNRMGFAMRSAPLERSAA